jgi:FPC/CPF motif-containing protein YcgG
MTQDIKAYHGMLGRRFVRLTARPTAPDPRAVLVHNQFRAMVLSETYTCLGGAAATRRGDYRLGLYPPLASTDAIARCARDLVAFGAEFPLRDRPVAVFVAAFDGPVGMDERAFEDALWRQLIGLREADLGRLDGAPAERAVIMDPGDPGFVFAGREFFVVGLHPAAPRWSRRFTWPTLVFNALSHHIPLGPGQFERLRDRIRDRDRRLQGTVSPYLDLPRPAQFAGRVVEPGWTCPITMDISHSGR